MSRILIAVHVLYNSRQISFPSLEKNTKCLNSAYFEPACFIEKKVKCYFVERFYSTLFYSVMMSCCNTTTRMRISCSHVPLGTLI